MYHKRTGSVTRTDRKCGYFFYFTHEKDLSSILLVHVLWPALFCAFDIRYKIYTKQYMYIQDYKAFLPVWQQDLFFILHSAFIKVEISPSGGDVMKRECDEINLLRKSQSYLKSHKHTRLQTSDWSRDMNTVLWLADTDHVTKFADVFPTQPIYFPIMILLPPGSHYGFQIRVEIFCYYYLG